MKFVPLLLCCYLFGRTVYGQDVQWRADRLQRKVFSYAQVCQAMGVKEAPLITSMGKDLDCMSTRVSLGEFCLQQASKRPFLRAVAIDHKREVTCEYGMRGILELSCAKTDCHHPIQQCQLLGKIYARQLDLIHSGVWAMDDIPQDNPLPWRRNNIEDSAKYDGLNIFAFSRLKLECIYEAQTSLWERSDGRL